ncbi:branched-chain amino acid ABC transporter permease [Phyllobacterium endophyticum]|uniref:Branched-chain amino acid ABC transporter permease n=1 Tax=Phyllobacterium endophyticum TaxID=1149773 RepID=A0A2P7AKP1_9HYPH|nr:branched-chain amino acid ABC transporter permease [Phyllobacterium endophyticum]MBB3233355.1 branched-chain amino acid transport system permease protein [Phyllobacterium endophyticum]PSH54774.1 branched-chain amino acid ABC transporter permease [Phyllobacterium endophyticum]TYR43359.1 branched-chain amino acid ABC transporter permease [Phyllobacterium endophyticum]
MPVSNSLRSLLPVLILLVLFALVPLLSPSNRFLSLAISAGINVIALYGLSVLFGQTGILSMGHAALVGIGAYTAAIVARDFNVGFWLSIPLAGIMAAIVAALIGVPSLRVSGHHFVIMTFAFGQLLSIILTNGGDYTGAASGLDVQQPVALFGLSMDVLTHYYLMVVSFVALSAIASWAIINSRYGRTLRAIRENEKLAASLGINVGRHKIGAFVVSGIFAGVSGVLLAYFLRHISPSQFASFPSIYLALMVMIGGARLLLGPLAGGILVAFLPELLNLDPVQSRILYGVCLIAVILLLPNGLIAGIVAGWYRFFDRRPVQPNEPAVEREGK